MKLRLSNLVIAEVNIKAGMIARILQNLPRNRSQIVSTRRQLWLDIQDIIGDHTKWPARIRIIIWKKSVAHFDRILLTTFAFINGLNLTVLIEFMLLVNRRREPGQLEEVCSLYQSFNQDTSRYSYYAYNVSNGRYEYLTGLVRKYDQKSLRDSED